jgi:hypothetical protein
VAFLRDIEESIAKGWKAVEDCSPIDWTGKATGKALASIQTF